MKSDFTTKKNIYLLTFSDKNYRFSAKRLVRQAKKFDVFRKIYSCTKSEIDNDFKSKYKKILDCKRGAGYWIWKPYLIDKYLKNLDYGDFLLYLDAGCSLNKKGLNRFFDYIKILEESDQGIISFDLKLPEYQYTNRACFEYFNWPKQDIYNGQLMATVLFMRKNDLLCEQITSWLNVVKENVNLFTDELTNNEIKDFKFHRHDQSIFSLIRKKYKPLILEDETYFKDFKSKKALRFPIHATRIGDTKKLFLKYYLRLL